MNVNVDTNSTSAKEFEMVPLISNEVETPDQRHVAVALEDSNNIPTDSIENIEAAIVEPSLATTNTITDIRTYFGPIVGYADEPLLPLHKACDPLAEIIDNISFYVQSALDKTPKQPPDGLTTDENAAIRLYTIQWEEPHRSLHSMLNSILRTANHNALRPYFKYLKLFLTALALECRISTRYHSDMVDIFNVHD